MDLGKLKVKVDPGIFSTERSVSFDLDGRRYAILVDLSELDGDELLVRIVEASDERLVIELPSAPPSGGKRVIVPRSVVLAA